MKLPPHLSSEIDYLIPNDIIDACRLDRFDIEIELYGAPSMDQYPQVRVWVDNEVIWDNQIIKNQTIKFSHKLNIQNKSVLLKIEYHNKNDITGTNINSQGQIIENQSVSIKKIVVNDSDIIKNNTVYAFGHYYPKLSETKIKHFVENGYSIDPSHSLDMFENGEWRLQFGIPVNQSIAKVISPQYTEKIKWPDHDFLVKIIKKCDRIRQLEQLKKIKLNNL
jgi:hypothetical protein